MTQARHSQLRTLPFYQLRRLAQPPNQISTDPLGIKTVSLAPTMDEVAFKKRIGCSGIGIPVSSA